MPNELQYFMETFKYSEQTNPIKKDGGRAENSIQTSCCVIKNVI